MNENEIQFLRDLLKEDRLEDVLDYMNQNFPDEGDIIQLCGNLQMNRDMFIRGQVSELEFAKSRDSLRYRVLNLLNSNTVYQYRKSQISTTPTYSSYRNEVYTIVFAVAAIVTFAYFIPKCELPVFHPVYFPTNPDQTQPVKPVASTLTSRTPYIQEKNMIAFDNQGKKAEYIVFIVRNFNWVLGEVGVSEMHGEESDICEHLKSIGVENRLNREDFKGIICFGNTSFEEDLSLPKKYRLSYEEDRADVRAIILSSCVSRILKKTTPVFTSNLGKYKINDEVTGYQREIMIVGIVQNDEGAIDEEALFNGLLNLHIAGDLQIDIREYSKVDRGIVPIEKAFN